MNKDTLEKANDLQKQIKNLEIGKRFISTEKVAQTKTDWEVANLIRSAVSGRQIKRGLMHDMAGMLRAELSKQLDEKEMQFSRLNPPSPASEAEALLEGVRRIVCDPDLPTKEECEEWDSHGRMEMIPAPVVTMPRDTPSWEELRSFRFLCYPDDLTVTTNAPGPEITRIIKRFREQLTADKALNIEELFNSEGWWAVSGCTLTANDFEEIKCDSSNVAEFKI